MGPTVWTARRKWLGNIVPALFWLPLLAIGTIWIAETRNVIGPGLWTLIAASLVGWVALNYLGLYENKRMQEQLERILTSGGAALPAVREFVGFATAGYASMLDPHEDVGFLCFLPDKLLFVSEMRHIEVERADVRRIGFRANAHTVLGLGRWICIDGIRHNKPIRMLIELRQEPTLFANQRLSKRLRERLKVWAGIDAT